MIEWIFKILTWLGDHVLTEWILGILAAFIGAVLGNIFALGRDLRKERNDARRPLWKWFDSHPSGRGEILPTAEDSRLREVLLNYKAVVSAKEWQRYQDHIHAIKKIRRPFQFGEYDWETGTTPQERSPTQVELNSISEHWESIKHLLRHRLLL